MWLYVTQACTFGREMPFPHFFFLLPDLFSEINPQADLTTPLVRDPIWVANLITLIHPAHIVTPGSGAEQGGPVQRTCS